MTQTPEAGATPPGRPPGDRGRPDHPAATVPRPVAPRLPPDDGLAELRDPGLAGLTSDRLLVELLSRLCRVMTADVAQFLLVEGNDLRVIATHGVPLDKVRDLRIPVGRGFTGRVAATAAPAVLDDTSTLEAFGPSWAAEGVRSLAGVPLVVEGRVVGVALVGSRSGRVFGPDDVSLLSAAADRAAWAMEHGILLASEREARSTAANVGERLDRLRSMAQALLSDLTVEAVVTTVVQRGVSLLGAFGGAVWEMSADGSTLVLRGHVGYPDEVEDRWREMSVDEDGPAPEAARLGAPVVIRSVSERDTRYPTLRGRATAGEAFIAAPLVVDSRTIGVLGLGFSRADDLDTEGLLFIDAATAQCAAALHRALVGEAREHHLAEARETARRLQSLQRVTAALADVTAGADAVDFILDEVTAAVGAVQAALCVLDEHAGVMRTVRSTGLDRQLTTEYADFPYEPGLPATDALLRREPVVLRTPAERDALYPALARQRTIEHAWACLPLVIGDRGVGVLALSLPAPQAFEAKDLEFLTALADQCGHALERRRLVDVEASNRTRLELLAEAGRIFSAPLDVRLTSTQFARLMVGRIADAVTVHLREPDGSYALAASEHADPDQTEAQRRIAANLPAPVVATYDQILDSGEPVLVGAEPIDDFFAALDDDEARLLSAARPARSNIVLPLVAGGHKLGVLNVTTVDGGHAPLGEADVEQLQELAGRLGLAVDSARLLRQQMEIAHTLQRSLLPASLPQVPGAEVAVRYLPGAEGVEVGGDFYDVVPLPSGRIGLVVGDVMGRGVRAAAVMGQLRAAVRSYCLEGHPPAALLTRLDRLVGTLEEGLLVTALYAEWDPARRTVRCSCAGHLPPLVRRPGEPAHFLEIDPGAPLGVGMQSYVEVEVTLPPGSLFLGYTDGLVEGPDLPHDEGMRRLAAALGDAHRAIDMCDAALGELRPLAADRRYDDDTALLAMVTSDPTERDATPPPDDPDVVTLDLPADTSSPGRARKAVAAMLDEWGMADAVDSAVLLTSEIVTNAVRHAGTGLRLTLQRRGEGRARIAVTDSAPGVAVALRASADDDETGRGLFLVEHLSAGWGSVVDDLGKTVWFEIQA